ncbi:MAG TPA: hypothetical protein VG711_03595 [Phycisphaerales bacterium]|nr:hypothetical protein [Phycisphaerales bacterium]
MLTLASDAEMFVPLVTGLVFITWILAAAVKNILVNRARENTRRDVAAYVAEGTIDADKAIAILNAGATINRP